MQEDRPLVTFAIATFNQQHLVQEAIAAALAQDYSPLEIYISDDSSTDGTFEVATAAVAAYDGPHSIVLNRNPANLGVGRHWDHIGRHAKGALIIHAAGDDVSVPQRTSTLVRHWLNNAPRPAMLSSDGITMTYRGVLEAPHFGRRRPVAETHSLGDRTSLDVSGLPICGFAIATDRRIYSEFDPIEDRMWSEDDILRRRALLIGTIAYIPDRLVHYRDGGISKGAKRSREAYLDLYRQHAESRIAVVKQSIADVTKLGGSMPSRLMDDLHRQRCAARWRLALIDMSFPASLVKLIQLLVFAPAHYGFSRKHCVSTFAVRWVPRLFFGLRGLTIGGRKKLREVSPRLAKATTDPGSCRERPTTPEAASPVPGRLGGEAPPS